MDFYLCFMHFKQLILTCFLLCLWHFSMAQIKDIGIPEIRNFRKQEYRAGAQNWQIERNSKNLMYFANNNGLLEFDGAHWQLYGLPNPSVVRSIKIDRNDRIYLGQQNEFGYMEPDEKGQLIYHSLSSSLPDKQRNFDEVWRIHLTGFGVVFQTYTHLFIYHEGELTSVPLKNRLRFSFFTNGRLWVQDEAEGLMELLQGRLVPIGGLETLKGTDIWSILPLSGGKVLIGTASHGVFIFDGQTVIPWLNEANKFLAENQLFSVIKINQSYLAFGTIQNGLLITDESGRIIQCLNKKKGLQNNTILSLGTDQNENLWLGLDNGIDYIEVMSPFTYLFDPEGLGATYTSLVHQGKLYVGTNHGLFVKDWPGQLSLNAESFRLVPGTVGQVWYLGLHQGVLLCGHDKGTFIITGEDARQIANVSGAWNFVSPPDSPNYLVGGNYSGLTLFRKTTDGQSWEFVSSIRGFYESSRLLAFDSDENLWMSHGYKGAYKIAFDDSFRTVLTYTCYNSEKGFPSDNFNNLMKIGSDILFTTADGIYTWNRETDRMESSSHYNKLFNWVQNADYILEDSYRNIWYNSGDGPGVLRFQEDGTYSQVSSPFSKLAGRLISGFQHMYVADEKNTFIALEDGLAHYSPNFQLPADSAYQVFIREVLDIPGRSSVFPAMQRVSVIEKQQYCYPFRGNNLRFRFACPNYRDSKTIRYSYFLKNYSEDWSSPTEASICEFMNLHEGSYQFQVKAIICDGVESNVAEFQFDIRPPWYRSILAYLLYVLVILTLLALSGWFIYFRIQVSQRKERLKNLQHYRNQMQQMQRDALIAEKEIVSLRNQQLHGKMIHLDKELANQTMGLIHKNKFLGKLKSELKGLQNQTADSALKTRIAPIISRIDKEFDAQKQNELFETYFDEVHEAFFKKLAEKYPTLTPREMKLCAYIKMNISTKEIATLLNISQRGVEISRYRLRKKLGVDRNTSLTALISGI